MSLNGQIEVYGKWGDARALAARDSRQRQAGFAGGFIPAGPGGFGDRMSGGNEHVHGMLPGEVERLKDRFEKFLPNLAAQAAPYQRAANFFEGMLPDGANLDPSAGGSLANAMARQGHRRRGQNLPYGGQLSGGSGGGGGSFQTNTRPYQPEFESPDRQNYPIHRTLANIYWRIFYKLDPIIGTCVDLFAEMPWSNFQLSGEGVTGEIKDALEFMCEETQLRMNLPYLVKEFMVIGEVAPHLFWDDDEGLWTHMALHNPDQLEVIHSPFLNMEPLVEFKPEDRLRQILTSNNPMLRPVRESMPEDILTALISGQNIPLSPVNCTFIARKLHPYDVRGTSIISRMWRILMYEDSIFNASIAIARRSAAPLKVAKLGDRATGWIPDPTQERRLLELLTQAEMDPAAWLVYHYGIEFDLVGAQERAWKIDSSAEFIERTKLIALGISKSFLHGEVTYASAASGLTVFLQRLKALREFFEAVWIYPKFFRPVAEMNVWVKPTQAELDHKVRTKRSKRELSEANRYIIPKIEWERPLDPSIDSAMIGAYTAISGLGVKFSKTTMAALVNRDYEKELQATLRETKMEQDLLAAHPELQVALAPKGEEGGGGGGPGGISPGMPPEAIGGDDGGGDMGGPPPDAGGGDAGGAPPTADADPTAATTGHGGTAKPDAGQGQGTRWNEQGKFGAWAKDEAEDLIGILRDGELPTEEPWSRMVGEWVEAAKSAHDPYARAALRALKSGDVSDAWEAAQEWLLTGGYPPKDVRDLEDILKSEGALTPRVPKPLAEKQAGIGRDLEHLLDKANQFGSESFLVGAPHGRKRK